MGVGEGGTYKTQTASFPEPLADAKEEEDMRDLPFKLE